MTAASGADMLAAPAEPDGAARIPVLDILRGLAILGILFMNINHMGGSSHASFGDPRHFGWSAADQAVWWVRAVFADGTARCLLEMLFGAGMVILTTRAADRLGASRWAVMRSYYWRNFVLFLFGLVHILILLWPGDILHSYAIAALLAFWFRNLRPRWLITIALLLATVQLAGGSYAYYDRASSQAAAAQVEAKRESGQALTAADRAIIAEEEKSRANFARHQSRMRADIAAEERDRTGTFATWARSQYEFAGRIQVKGIELIIVWEALSTMLLGAALFKLGILQGGRDRRYYLKLMILAYALGGLARAVGAWEETRFDAAPKTIWATMEYARIFMTIGHVALVNWMVKAAGGLRLLRPFVAAGRAALSIYIAQTIVCMWILYPPFALGLYNKTSWWGLMLTALIVNAALTWAAMRWFERYRIAPVEWAWRSLVEMRRLPFRKRAQKPVGRPAEVAAG